MKKVLSIFLATLFCISSALGMFTTVSAEDDISDNLKVHYDFAGDDPLKDKAGSVNDALKASASGITTANGVATDDPNGVAYLVQTGAASASDDMKAVLEGDEMTFIARFKIIHGKCSMRIIKTRIQDSNNNPIALIRHVGAIKNTCFVYFNLIRNGTRSRRRQICFAEN